MDLEEDDLRDYTKAKLSNKAPKFRKISEAKTAAVKGTAPIINLEVPEGGVTHEQVLEVNKYIGEQMRKREAVDYDHVDKLLQIVKPKKSKK